MFYIRLVVSCQVAFIDEIVFIYYCIDRTICQSIIKRCIFAIEINNDNKYIRNMEKFNDIIKGDQLTLVDFYATWCGPCKQMHPVLEQLKHELGDSIRVIKLDVDKNNALALQYRIQSVPTLMLFKSGENIWRQSGAMRLGDLKKLIGQYSNK